MMRTFLGALGLFSLVMSAQDAQAACIGLEHPAPKNTNICERLLERLVIPRTEVFCDIPWWARIGAPHCNIPGACHVDPVCKAFESTRELEALVFNAGDLYCEFREIDPEEMIEKIGFQLYSDAVTLTTGGTSSILYDVGNRHLDTMSCAGTGLNSRVKDHLRCVSQRLGLTPEQSWSEVDTNRVTVVSVTNPTADLYLRDGFAAITLNDLVIMRDPQFQTLRSWSKNVGDSLTPAEINALVLMIHELVHVRQYRNFGKETFINRYLTEALANGYVNISTEQEANRIEELSRPIVEGGCRPDGAVVSVPEPLRERLIVADPVLPDAALVLRRAGEQAVQLSPTARANLAQKLAKPNFPLEVLRSDASRLIVAEHDPKTCFNAVQNNIAWNHSGATSWNLSNVEALCKGNPTSREPADCFDMAMHKIKWPDDQPWVWQDASRLCSGTRDMDPRLDCMMQQATSSAPRAASLKLCSSK